MVKSVSILLALVASLVFAADHSKANDRGDALMLDNGINQRDRRKLQTPTSYFRRYKKQFGRTLKKCKFLKGATPQNNTQCKKMKIGGAYTKVCTVIESTTQQVV